MNLLDDPATDDVRSRRYKMAAANSFAKYRVFNLMKTSCYQRFSQATDIVMSNGESELWSPEERRSRSENNNPEIGVKFFEVIESFFGEKSKCVQRINVHPTCMPHSSRFGKNCKVLLINGMKSSGWLPLVVNDLLNFLVCGTNDFRLIIAFPKDEPPNNNDSDLFWDFRFIWDITGFVCIVKECKDGFVFEKDLILIDQPSSKDYYLISVKWKNLCVVMDGEKILLEPMHHDKFVRVWQYNGKENDTNSRHHGKGWLSVFGLKLKSTNSDVTMCLGAADNTRVGLMPANTLPEHGSLIKTKADHRFFYGSTLRGFSTFESTQFENHYLAVDDIGAGPQLCLKEVTEKEKEYDHDEILFQTVPK